MRATKRTLAAAAAAIAVTGAAVLDETVTGDHDAHAQNVGPRPNVVVIQTDDQTAESLRVMPMVRRHLIDEGTTFNNYYATHPRCCPSRASYLTGQYSHNHGVESNSPSEGGGYPALDHSQTLPVWLRRAGYTTAHIGKYLNGFAGETAAEIPKGWSEFYAAFGSSTYLMYDYRLNENGEVVEYGSEPDDYQTDVFADKAVDFIARRADEAAPFFLSLNPTAPHKENTDFGAARNPRPAPRHNGYFEEEPLPRPPSFNEADVSDKPKFIRKRERLSREQINTIQRRYRSRLESLLAVDDAVGRITETLAQEGELENTLILFISDNGLFAGEHRLDGGKVKLYEEAVRVPLVMRGPGVPVGQSREQLSGNIDLAPTILDVANGSARKRVMDGRSLMPLAEDPNRVPERDILLENGGESRGIRTPRYAYFDHDGGGRELYDMKRDPFQLESQRSGDEYRDVRDTLSERLADLRKCSGDSCRKVR